MTDSTTRALFILDALEPGSDDALAAAAEELTSTLRKFGPDVHVEQRIIGAAH